MGKLYEITARYKNIEHLLNCDDISPETLKEALEQIEGEFQEKAESICKLMRNNESDIEGIRAEEKRLADRRRTIENKNTNLKAYLESNMLALGVGKIKGNIFTVAMQKNAPSVEIESLEDIPKDYFVEQQPVLNKKLISEILKSGEQIRGAILKQTQSLRIR